MRCDRPWGGQDRTARSNRPPAPGAASAPGISSETKPSGGSPAFALPWWAAEDDSPPAAQFLLLPQVVLEVFPRGKPIGEVLADSASHKGVGGRQVGSEVVAVVVGLQHGLGNHVHILRIDVVVQRGDRRADDEAILIVLELIVLDIGRAGE